jgi:hypothetical protein
MRPVEIIKDSIEPVVYYAENIPMTVSYFVVKPYNNKYIKSSIFSGCREVITENIIRLVNTDKTKPNKIRVVLSIPLYDKHIYTNKISKLTPTEIDNFDNFNKNRIFIAKRLINIVEEYAGFGKTKIIPAVMKNNDRFEFWIFNSASGWLHNTMLISLYLLLTRITLFMTGDMISEVNKIKNFDDIILFFQKDRYPNGPNLSNKLQYDSNLYRDYMHMEVITKNNRLKIIFENRRKLFEKSERYKIGKMSTNGITSLCTCATFDRKLNIKFESLSLTK